MQKVEHVKRLNERELSQGISGNKSSWHDEFKHSAYIYIGGLKKDLSEGDVIASFPNMVKSLI